MKKRIELRHLRALVALVEEGGYVRAARALGVSQSTLSETIRSLERLVGGVVAHRNKHAVLPTPIGTILLPFARRMLALESRALARLGSETNRLAASVVVCCSESISAYLLPPVLRAVRGRWPGSYVQIQTATCRGTREGLKSGRFDVGLVCEPRNRARRETSEILTEADLVLFCAGTNPLGGREVALAELQSRPFHLSDAAGSFAGLLQHQFKVAGDGPAAVLAAGSVEGVKRAVASDDESFGLLPLFAVEEELYRGTLARVFPRPALPSLVLKALFARGRQRPLVADFVQALRDSLPTPPGREGREQARAGRT